MATITRADGTTEFVGESTGEFIKRQSAIREAERTGQKSLASRLKQTTDFKQVQALSSVSVPTSNVTEAQKVAINTKTGELLTATDVKILESKQNLVRNYKGPRGAKEVKRVDGRTVYRIAGKNAQGQYIKDYYVEDKIPSKNYNKIIVETRFIGEKPQKRVSTTPALDVASTIQPQQPGQRLSEFAEKLVKREKRLTTLKTSIYDKLGITGKDKAKFYNIKEVAKGIARVPFELASIPSFVFGRSQFVALSLTDPVGRKNLVKSFGKTPGAVREVFVEKDPNTGKYQFTAQNVVNVGLLALAVRSVAKSPKNKGLIVYEKYAKTNIKGTIKGTPSALVFKSAGKLKGRPYTELTVFRGKASTSTIKYQGKTFIINRDATGKGTFKILKQKTKVKIQRKGPVPKKASLEKEFVVLRTGKLKADGKPIQFKNTKGVTTQDIKFLNTRPLSKTYIGYLEQLKTSAKAKGTIQSGRQQLQFKAQTQVKAKAELGGVITKQFTSINRLDYLTGQKGIVREFKTPKISFGKGPKVPKDVVINQYVKQGQAITGFEKGFIAQPRFVLKGPKATTISGEFAITGGKGFNIFKGVKLTRPLKGVSNIPGNLILNFRLMKLRKAYRKSLKESQTEFTGTPTKATKTKGVSTVDFSKQILQKSKPGEQILLTEQILGETQPVINIPFQTKAPSVKFTPINFKLLDQPLSGVRAVPLVPGFKPTISFDAQTPPPTPTPAFDVKITQEVRPTTTFGVKSLTEQLETQKPTQDIFTGQKTRGGQKQQPKTVIDQLTEQAQKSKPLQAQTQLQKQTSIFKNVFDKVKTPSIFQQQQLSQIPKIPNIFGSPGFQQGSKRAGPGFDVFTRIKGIFKKANIQPLSKVDAINFGAFKVQTTSQATFKIQEANGQIGGIFKTPANLKDFYKKDDLFIEKKERRIKSIGELQEITFKGLQTIKNKNIFGGKK